MGKWIKGRVSADGAIGVAIGAGAITLMGIAVAIIMAIFYDSLLAIWLPLIISVGFVFMYLLLAPRKYK